MYSHARKLGILGVVIVLALVIVACAPKEPELGSPENPIVFTFTPSGQQEDVVAGMEAVGELLQEATGYTIETRLVNSYNAAVEALCSGQAQVSHLGNFPYIIANDKCGVQVAGVFIRFGSDTYATQIIARTDSGFTDLADLEGKRACWNDPLSASGYVAPIGILGDAGVLDSLQEPVWVGSHASVVSSLYEGGICDFGATWVDARGSIEDDNPDVKEVVSVVYTSEEFLPNDMFVTVADLDPEIRKNIVDALVAIPETEDGKAAYDRLYQIEGVAARDDTFFDTFRVYMEASGLDIEELFE
jgi:phosphonate transport system substrate-binding protein